MPAPISSAYTIASGQHLKLGTGTPPVTHALTFSAPDTATVDVGITITITNTGTVSENWSIVPPANFTLSSSAGTIAAGATVNITGTASQAGSYSITLLCPGATIIGVTQTVVASVPASGAIVVTGPSSGLARAVSGMFTVSFSGTLTGPVVVTLSDGDSNSRVYSHSIFDALGTVTITPAEPVAWCYYAPSSSGAKSIAVTNDSSLTNPSAVAYTATAASGSATPFRLTRGGSTIGSYATLQACQNSGAWASGDVVKVAAGTYAVDTTTAVGATNLNENGYAGGSNSGIGIDVLTIEAEDINNPPLLDFSWQCAKSGKAGDQFEAIKAGADCHAVTVRGIHMRGLPQPAAGSALQACFWQETDWPAQDGATSTFTFDRCLIQGWGDGIKGRNHASTSWHVNSCVFIDNSDGYGGLHHDIYIDRGALLEVVGCTFIRTGTLAYKQDGYGHFVKSRCRATTVKASRLYAYMDAQGFGGANSLINTPCGGVVEITGNTLIDYGAMSNGSGHNILRGGEQQFPTSGEWNPDPLLLTHSYLIAQNTMLQLRGYPLGDGNSVPVVKLYHNNTGNPSGALVATGIPTQALTGTGVLVDVTTTIRNNIVANYDSSQAAAFLALYPNNTLASTGQISEVGYYSGGTVAGTPAVNDADLEWAGDYLAPVARTDTNRGARTEAIPSWVPATAWQWTDVPSSTWDTYMIADGSGIAPDTRQSTGDAGPNWTYAAQWSYSGPAYSRKNHEVWLFGGGHAATTNNILAKWRLHRESPDIVVASPPTSVSIRNAYLQAETWRTTSYHTDGRPGSPHSYYNNLYSDSTDEFISFGIDGIATGWPIASGVNAGSMDIAALPRSGVWRPENYYPDVTKTISTHRGPRMISDDGATVYYWDGSDANPTAELRKFVFSTKTHTNIGPSVIPFYSAQADGGSGVALIIGGSGSSVGWQVKFVTLATGNTVDVTVSGDSIPAGLTCHSVTWCSSRGYYVSVWINTSAAFSEYGVVTNTLIATITPTGANTATASVKSMTGSGPTRAPVFRGAFYDPLFDAVIFVTGISVPLKVFKVA